MRRIAGYLQSNITKISNVPFAFLRARLSSIRVSQPTATRVNALAEKLKNGDISDIHMPESLMQKYNNLRGLAQLVPEAVDTLGYFEKLAATCLEMKETPTLRSSKP